MDKQKVLIKAPTNDFSGYATVARNLVLELAKMDKFDLYLEDIVWINSGNLELQSSEQQILNDLRGKQLGNPAETVLVHFSIATEFFGGRSPFQKTIGFTMMETDKVAQYWAHKCNQMDAIFVPSTFNLSSFMQSNVVKPIRIIPFGLDMDTYTPVGEKLLNNLPTKFNFLTVGQWLQEGDRKNIAGTIQAFLNTFRGNPDVGLILKTYCQGAGTLDKLTLDVQLQGIRRQLGFAPNEGPQIYVVHGAIAPENMIKLYRNADAFLLPTAGEAWGMPLMEAAAMEVPIVTTGGTGAEMFLNPEYAIMLGYEWQDIGNKLSWPGVYEPGQSLAIPDMEEFIRMMMRVYKHNGLAKEQAKKQREELIEREFTWKHSAELFSQAIEDMVQ